MNQERWREVDRIFRDVVEQTPEERASFLQRVCSDDASLRKEVEDLIQAYERSGSFLDSPGSVQAPGSWIGRTLGSYEFKALLGSGGMGEVYRARDCRLKRDVAIKVLRESFSRDPDRVARFQREAEVLAALNHPNIGAIYDLAEFGGSRFLVLELVEGETLAELLACRSIPINEALEIAKEIAEALEAAHEKGIIHRDLKPANVKIAPEGRVKLLDFGLAKMRQIQPEGTVGTASAGMILGTAAYMSPEQANGKEAGRASDVWSFGCVLYEILARQRAFSGETTTEILAQVLRGEPDWSRLPSDIPESVRRLIARCLQKDVRQRLRDMGDVRIQIEDIPTETRAPDPTVRAATPKHRARTIVFALLISVVTAVAMWRLGPAVRVPETRIEINAFPTRTPTSLAISPDGRKIVFEFTSEGRSALWLRSLDTGQAHRLEGTQSELLTHAPFWSPDGRSVGFFTSPDYKLKTINIGTGAVQTLANLVCPCSGTWNRDGTIVASAAQGTGILRVSSVRAGESKSLLRPDGDANLLFPEFLPDGRHFVYYAAGERAKRGVYVSDIDGMPPRRVLRSDTVPVFAPSGHLLFVNDQTLFAQKFDLEKLEVIGNPVSIAEGVAVVSSRAAVSVSSAGPIVYRTGTKGLAGQLVWFDRSGRELKKSGDMLPNIAGFSLSPNNRTVALARTDNGNTDIWLLDTAENRYFRFTTDPAVDQYPVWSTSGRCIVFHSDRNGKDTDLYAKSVVGDTPEERLLDAQGNQYATDFSSDGRFLLYVNVKGEPQSADVFGLPVDENCRRTGDPLPVAQSEFDERPGVFSPDGKWVAYSSNRTGVFGITIRPFNSSGPETFVARGGAPRWRHDGKELFYIGPDGWLMSVPVQNVSGAIEVGSATRLFIRTYMVSVALMYTITSCPKTISS
jgi:serine/threonine protein kinase